MIIIHNIHLLIIDQKFTKFKYYFPYKYAYNLFQFIIFILITYLNLMDCYKHLSNRKFHYILLFIQISIN